MSMKYILALTVQVVLAFVLLVPVYAGQVEDNTVIHRITVKDGKIYSWLHHGLLFSRSYYDRNKRGDYLYCGDDGYLVAVSSIADFSTMIREQFDDNESAISFLRECLPRVIFAFLGPPRADVLDKEYLDYRKALPSNNWVGVSDSEIKRSFEILKKHEYSGPIIKNGKWRTEFYVSLQNGSIEKWDLDGEVQPFSVDHLTKTVVEKEKTIAREQADE